jgi:hypothetical protein
VFRGQYRRYIALVRARHPSHAGDILRHGILEFELESSSALSSQGQLMKQSYALFLEIDGSSVIGSWSVP